MTETIKSSYLEPGDLVVEALPCPYRAILKTDYYLLREKFDEYWKEKGEVLANTLKYKGKKNKKGNIDLNKAKEAIETTYPLAQIYQPILVEFVVDTLNKEFKEEPKEVLFLSELNLHAFGENELPIVVSTFYFWPELTFSQEINFNLKREVERDFNTAFEKRCNELVEKHKNNETGACLLVDDEALYKAEGAESKEAFKAAFEGQYNSYMDNSDKHFAVDHVMDQILRGATLEAVPQRWLDMNSENFLNRYLKQFNGNMNVAMQMVGAKSEAEMKRMLEGQVYRETVQRMAINWYAKKFNIANNVEAVSADILSKINWVTE